MQLGGTQILVLSCVLLVVVGQTLASYDEDYDGFDLQPNYEKRPVKANGKFVRFGKRAPAQAKGGKWMRFGKRTPARATSKFIRMGRAAARPTSKWMRMGKRN